MRNKPHKKPRQNALFDAVHHYVRETAVSMETYCANVVEHYEATVYPRGIEFSQHEDVSERRKRNCNRITRWIDLDAHARFPTEMEESLVMALPDAYRLPLLSKLAARYDLIATPMPDGNLNHTTNLARLCKEFADVVETMGPLIADGTLENDSPGDIDDALDQANELMAEVTGWVAQLKRARKLDLKAVK